MCYARFFIIIISGRKNREDLTLFVDKTEKLSFEYILKKGKRMWVGRVFIYRATVKQGIGGNWVRIKEYLRGTQDKNDSDKIKLVHTTKKNMYKRKSVSKVSQG